MLGFQVQEGAWDSMADSAAIPTPLWGPILPLVHPASTQFLPSLLSPSPQEASLLARGSNYCQPLQQCLHLALRPHCLHSILTTGSEAQTGWWLPGQCTGCQRCPVLGWGP